MAAAQPFDIAAFAAAYQELARAVKRAAPARPGPFTRLLGEHLARDITELAVVSMDVDVFEQPSLQRASRAMT